LRGENLMFKFELGDVIYYHHNKILSAPVLSRMRVENAHPDWNDTAGQQKLFQMFGSDREVYATCHGNILAEEAFRSARELAEWLIKDAEGE